MPARTKLRFVCVCVCVFHYRPELFNPGYMLEFSELKKKKRDQGPSQTSEIKLSWGPKHSFLKVPQEILKQD